MRLSVLHFFDGPPGDPTRGPHGEPVTASLFYVYNEDTASKPKCYFTRTHRGRTTWHNVTYRTALQIQRNAHEARRRHSAGPSCTVPSFKVTRPNPRRRAAGSRHSRDVDDGGGDGPGDGDGEPPPQERPGRRGADPEVHEKDLIAGGKPPSPADLVSCLRRPFWIGTPDRWRNRSLEATT